MLILLVAVAVHGKREPPLEGTFVVEGIFADFKRHDLGPAFHERNFDGSIQKEFVTEPLWGVGSTAPEPSPFCRFAFGKYLRMS